MKFSIATVAFVAALLSLCLCQIHANDDVKSTTPATYFGVDANDAEAVKAKQRELSEDKFRELFGDEAHEEFNRIDLEDAPKPDEKAWSISESLKKVADLIKQGKDLVKNKLEARKGVEKKD